MSLTDEELREEKTQQDINDYGWVVVNSNSAAGIERSGIFVVVNEITEAVLPIKEATALRDGLTVVIDQYHDFIARRDAKTNQEIIDEMEPGTVFSFDWHEGGRIYSKGTNGKVYSHFSGTFLDPSSFRDEATITVVDQ